MSNRPEKKSGWCQSLKEHHLWPMKWPQKPWFVKLYFIMLLSILAILGISFLFFMFRAGNGVSNDSGMEVTIGITVGMFGILATFAVVFLAFRAEETAVSTASEVAKKFSERTFSDEEEKTFEMLQHPISYYDSSNYKKEEIDEGVDTSGWQLFAWGAVFFLVPVSLVWPIYFLFHEILPSGSNSNSELEVEVLTLWIVGMLGVLITFTVILFAARVAQLSQIAGRIKSYSIIEKLAASEEKLYHELFEAIDKVCGHVKNESLTSAEVARFKLLKDIHQNFDREKIENFEALLNERVLPSNVYSRWIAFVAFLMICFIGLDMLWGEAASIRSIGGIISSSAVLFTFLIFSISVFFLGRIFRSAIASSRKEATKASYFEFNQKRIELKNRIQAFREIEKNKTLLYEFSDSLASVESFLKSAKEDSLQPVEEIITKNTPVGQIVNILLHLRHLKKISVEQNQTMEGYLHFNRICEGPKEWFEGKRRNFQYFVRWGKVGAEFPSQKQDMVRMMEKARELDESVLRLTVARARPKREDYGSEDDYLWSLQNYDAYPEMDIEYYHEQDFLDYEEEMKKKEAEKLYEYLNARIKARNMLRKLIYMAKLCVMIKLLNGGLLVLKNDIMVRVEEADPEDADTTKIASPSRVGEAAKTVFETLKDESFTPRTLDMSGSEPIFTSDLIEALRSVKKLWKDLDRFFQNAESNPQDL